MSDDIPHQLSQTPDGGLGRAYTTSYQTGTPDTAQASEPKWLLVAVVVVVAVVVAVIAAVSWLLLVVIGCYLLLLLLVLTLSFTVCMSTTSETTNWHTLVAQHPGVQLPASAPPPGPRQRRVLRRRELPKKTSP